MPRPRINDPFAADHVPRVATDPKRARELREEFERRLRYVSAHHREMRAAFGPPGSFNTSVKRLAKAVSSERRRASRRRFHPFIELMIVDKARALARCRSSGARIEQEDVDRAAIETVAALGPQRGAPTDPVLVHLVEGLMALLQESSGLPVLVQRYRNGDYEPHAANKSAEALVALVRTAEPHAPMHRIVNIVLAARKRHVGRPMRFRDYFPLYGAVIDEGTGLPTGGIGGRVEQVQWAPPIYCP